MGAVTFPGDVVRRLHEVTRRVGSSTDLAEVLEEIAQGVVEGLGYGVAAISRLEGDTLVTTTVAGNDEVREAIIGRRTPAEEVLGREYSIADHWGILRFVPHDRIPVEELHRLWIPDIEVSEDPAAWHPLDGLYAPLYSAEGELLGNMSVDLPPGLRVPDQEQRELLEMFVVQAGLALGNAQRREQLSRQVRLGAALRQLTSKGAHGDLGEALRDAVCSLVDAMVAAQVTARCFAHDTDGPMWQAAGFPVTAEAPVKLVRALRAGLQSRLARGEAGPTEIPPNADSPDLAESRDLIREHMAEQGWVRGLLAPIHANRKVLGYLVVLRGQDDPAFDSDETEAVAEAGRELGRLVRDARLRHTERRLLAELRELDRYKGELIATISHELKTPLTSIIGHTELLEDAEVMPASVSAIARNAARLERLINNLLNYSRIQKRRELEPQPLDLGTICRASLEMLAMQAEAGGVDVSLDAPGTAVIVAGDPDELPRVVDNLCSNAVKYTPQGGRIVVTVSASADFAEVSVADTGLGISEDDMAHLFSPFHRSTNPHALTIPGTGLGLAISRRIIELHGGTITVDSELGRGSTFTMRLPLASS